MPTNGQIMPATDVLCLPIHSGMNNLNRNHRSPGSKNSRDPQTRPAIPMHPELNAKPQRRRGAEIRMLSCGTGANLPLMRADNPHSDQLIPCAFAPLRLCVKKLAELLRLSVSGACQTCRPAKIRIASSGGPLRVSASSHNAQAQSSRFATIPDDSRRFQGQKNYFCPPNHQRSYLLSPICSLPIWPARQIATNRGQSCLIALKKEELLRTPFLFSAFYFLLFSPSFTLGFTSRIIGLILPRGRT
jgi:hypothetical protein